MSRLVLWSPGADLAYLEILEYIVANISSKAVEALNDEVEKQLNLIIEFPQRWPISNEVGLHRAVVKQHYLIIYRVHPQYIEIVDFIDNRSNHSY